jgi:hypothetical protein
MINLKKKMHFYLPPLITLLQAAKSPACPFHLLGTNYTKSVEILDGKC